MPEPVVEIPDRPAFRSAEVCEIAQIPPYVLKSWEKEFPGLGVAPKPGGPRVYRRSDVEQVLRIKHLLFAEGLTLAGARRKLEGEPQRDEEPLPDLGAVDAVRAKVAGIRRELQSLLQMLSDEVPRPPGASAAPTGPSPAASGAPPASSEGPGNAPAEATSEEESWPPSSPGARHGAGGEEDSATARGADAETGAASASAPPEAGFLLDGAATQPRPRSRRPRRADRH